MEAATAAGLPFDCAGSLSPLSMQWLAKSKYGVPDAICRIQPGPKNGYQSAAELDWWRGGNLIRAVFRDTTIEAMEGCLSGDLTAGPCGLTGQLFVRISPPAADLASCSVPH